MRSTVTWCRLGTSPEGKPAADLPLTPTPGISAAQGYPTKISPRLPGPRLWPAGRPASPTRPSPLLGWAGSARTPRGWPRRAMARPPVSTCHGGDGGRGPDAPASVRRKVDDSHVHTPLTAKAVIAMSQPYVIRGSLTREIDNTSSPVRQFLDERFTSGLKDLQRRFRQAAPAVVVPSVPQAEANPGTVGGAADWLLRFMVCPDPSVSLAVAGAAHLSEGMMMGVAGLAEMLGV